MNKLLICSILYIGICITSCKKSEKNKLMGTWTVTEFASDENGNKVMDAAEVKKAATGPMMTTAYTFKSGDKLEVLWGDVTENGSWKLKTNSELQVTLSGGGTLYKLTWQGDKKLTTETSGTGGMLFWQTLEKQ